MAEVAKAGDKVAVHYTGRLADGTVFDSSEGRSPLEFALGSGQMIAGFDAAVHGMAVGDKKSTEIACLDAYGPRVEDMIVRVPRANVPEDINPEEGQELMLTDTQGNHIPATVTSITEEFVELDANHSLAGKDLIFDITLVSINAGGEGKSRIITDW